MDPDAEGPIQRDGLGDVADQYDPDAVEARVFEHWDAVDAYERTAEHRADAEPFFFVDGPPYTSGSAHMGTTWNKTLKDAFIRFYRMNGYDVTDRPGFDMHGLPIETRVEERLDFESKQDIEEFGMENFIQECREYAEEQLVGLREDFESFGVWMDWENPYKTVSPEYVEATWWGFKQAYERGLVERGERSINQCPRCETAIANNEVERHEVTKPSVYVRFPLRDREGSLVVWTTTPWTFPANTFVAVDGAADYVGVRVGGGEGEILYVSAARAADVVERAGYEEYEVVSTHVGEDLVGWQYEHPLAEEVPDHPTGDDVGQVYTAEYADPEDKTGLVHSAPGHGEEDFERGRELGLPTFCPVGGDGVFTSAGGKYAGQFVREANEQIIDDLEAAGLLLASESGYTVNEGQCWRCDTDIVRLVTDQWFITVTDIKDELLANIEDSSWHPEGARDERFRNFVEDSPDWNVSRQRYWGTPLPIWTPEDWDGTADDIIVVGDREELAARVDQDVDPDGIDLHRPTVDDLTITEDGRTYTRVPDVFDVWLDSSVASWGTLDYPSETDAFDALWPADLIIEAHDQTRGWFWSQLGMGTAALDEIPYEEVLMHGHALMPDGRAMSKSRGITVEPSEAIEANGVDPMRGFLLSVTPQGDDMRFSWEEMEERQRQLNILWNVFRFPLPYMELDDYDPATANVADAALTPLDQWLLSRLQSVEATVHERWEDREPHRALQTVLEFVVEDVSRYYVQAVRERMWTDGEDPAKTAAYETLTKVLHEVVRLLAPYMPFVTEAIYQHLTGEEGYPTVHMCEYPVPDESRRDQRLEAEIQAVRVVEEAGANARQQAGRKLRWPVPQVIVDTTDEAVAAAVETHRELLADRLNARAVDVVRGWEDVAYRAEADMSVLGPAFGEEAQAVMRALNEARVSEPSLDALEPAVAERLDRDVELTDEMVEFVEVTPENVAAAAIPDGTVYVDTDLTDDIRSEGYAREVIRRVQEMRKDLDLAMDQAIELDIKVFDEDVAQLVADREALVATETRAESVGPIEADEPGSDTYTREWEIEGTPVELTIRPLPGVTA
ncbi:MAG: isoleucine--tRNA ligase [Halobacteriaceae archaeon]